ncbi:MAG: Lrp/AsnC family transcriptional regulator [Crenarchaeota archaeon]|nr:Lrp/AsnC family transcriptional regulator [Thermoproteota archaeon]
MDKLDFLIIKELLKDPLTSFSNISKNTGVSMYTIRKRYDKMRENKILFDPIIAIDLSKIGYQGKTFLLITETPNHEKSKTVDELSKIRNIISISEVVGAFDIIAIAPVIDFNDIMELVKKIKELPGVLKVETTLIKDTEFPISLNFNDTIAKKYVDPKINL